MLGVYPQLLFKIFDPAVTELVVTVAHAILGRTQAVLAVLAALLAR